MKNTKNHGLIKWSMLIVLMGLVFSAQAQDEFFVDGKKMDSL